MCMKINLRDAYGFGHYRYKALEYSAKYGCLVCQYFLASIPPASNDSSADLTVQLKYSTLRYKYSSCPEQLFELCISTG
jgi:hypothetical protein